MDGLLLTCGMGDGSEEKAVSAGSSASSSKEELLLSSSSKQQQAAPCGAGRLKAVSFDQAAPPPVVLADKPGEEEEAWA